MTLFHLIRTIFEIIVGIIFIVAAVGKYIAPTFFIFHIRELYPNNNSHPPLFYIKIAFIITGIELQLGIALILNCFSPIPAILTIILLLLFTSFTWFNRKKIDDCGCLGIFFSRTPTQSVVENVILILLLSVVLLSVPNYGISLLWRYVVFFVVLTISILLPIIFIFIPHKYPRLKYSFLKQGGLIKNINFLTPKDWESRKILLVATSKSCHFCLMQLPFLNAMSTLLSSLGDTKVHILLSEKDGGKLPVWIDINYQIFYIKNFHHFGLISNGKPASALIEDGKIVKVWNFMLPFPWDLINKDLLTNNLDVFFVNIFQVFSKYYKQEDHKFLITVLFEQGIRLFNEKSLILTSNIFINITSIANNWININNAILAKAFVNLSLVQIHLDKFMEASTNFVIAADCYDKEGLSDSMVNSFAISFSIASVFNELDLMNKIRNKFIQAQKKYIDKNLFEKFNAQSCQLINKGLNGLKEIKLEEP